MRISRRQLAARAALEHLNRERPEIVVLTGDMTESPMAMDQVRDAWDHGHPGPISLSG